MPERHCPETPALKRQRRGRFGVARQVPLPAAGTLQMRRTGATSGGHCPRAGVSHNCDLPCNTEEVAGRASRFLS